MRMLTNMVAVLLVLAGLATAGDVVPIGSQWSYLNPQTLDANPANSDASFDANWFKPGFDLTQPNAWSGPSPGPFARKTSTGGSAIQAFDPDHRSFIREAGTLIDTPATGHRATAYFRHEFSTAQPLRDFALEFLADDGVTFYLDGQELLRHNCCTNADGPVPDGTSPVFTSLASTNSLASEREYFLAPVLFGQELAAGNHVLAASVHNIRFRDSDIGFSARLIDGYIYRPLIESDSEWKYFEGEDEPSGGTLNWTTQGFNDNPWDTGQEGFGYEFGALPGALPLINTELDSMQELYSSLYLRKTFSIENLDELSGLELMVDYDDGFVAYINGHEVTRSNVPGEVGVSVPFDSLATPDHESTNGNGDPGELFSIDLSEIPNISEADNVLAIHGLNTELDSSDFVIAQIALAGIGGLDGGLPGDFDGNGVRDAADIDALSAAVRGGQNPSEFDVTSDGLVNDADRIHWIEVLKNTYLGDSTLDGEFSTGDLVEVFQKNEFEDGIPSNSGWATGDWSGDGDFTTSDFVTAFVADGFEKGPRPGGVNIAAVVPEPTSALGWLLATMALLVWRKR